MVETVRANFPASTVLARRDTTTDGTNTENNSVFVIVVFRIFLEPVLAAARARRIIARTARWRRHYETVKLIASEAENVIAESSRPLVESALSAVRTTDLYLRFFLPFGLVVILVCHAAEW
jgi:hypothetical protein